MAALLENGSLQLGKATVEKARRLAHRGNLVYVGTNVENPEDP